MSYILVIVLLAVTGIGLLVSRHYRESRDARLSESSGGWRMRAQLGLDPGDPYSRFSGLALTSPHNVMEGTEEGFEVSYFDISPLGRDTTVVRPCAIVQLPVNPPQRAVISTDGVIDATVLAGWGTRASRVLTSAQGGLRIKTAQLAILVESTRAPSDAVSRVALALARAIVDDAGAAGASST